MDASDILGAPQVAKQDSLAAILHKDRVAKPVAATVDPQKEKRLYGLHKELFELVGGRTPLAPSSGYTSEKAKLGSKVPAQRWEWRRFDNPARQDGLQLSHWVKQADHSEYSFAKCNKAVTVVHFSAEDYHQRLEDPKWTYEETRILFQLCQQFDLRFIIIHDRFIAEISTLSRTQPPGALKQIQASVEDLKQRYYAVTATMNQTQTTGHTAAAFFYDLRHETLRKQQLERLMSRSWDQVAEETQLKADLKKIEEKRQDLRQVSLGVASLAVSDGAALDPSKKAPKKLKHKDQDSKSDTQPSALAASNPPSVVTAQSAASTPVRQSYLRSAKMAEAFSNKQAVNIQLSAMSKHYGLPPILMGSERVHQQYDVVREAMVHLINLQTAATDGQQKHASGVPLTPKQSLSQPTTTESPPAKRSRKVPLNLSTT
eukprot:m.109432 g.109432  ORF g.109432 m.109432 type:complete len:430 (-) comp51764_c0_seq7:64-1353(-)